jgi:hypothetical protein
VFRNIVNFFKTIFCRSHAVEDNFAILNDYHFKELESRVKRLELASLTMLKRLVQLNTDPIPNDAKTNKKLDKFLYNNYLTDDTNQPTIH